MKNYLLLIALFIYPTFSFTQITFLAEDLPVEGDIFINYVDTMPSAAISVGLPGPDQIWDFTGLVQHDSLMQGAIDPVNAYGGSSFPSADIALTTSNAVGAQFAEVGTDALIGIGIVIANPLGGEPLIVDIDPTQTVYKVPTAYEDNYIDEWGFVVGVPSFLEGIDSLRITNNVTTHTDIDAWGTMMLPNGDHDVIRRRDSTISEQIIEGLVGIFWIPVQNETSTNITYNFLAKETKGSLVNVALDPLTGENDQVTWVNLSDETIEIPAANFSVENIGTPQERTYFFTDLSTNEPDAWFWDFGDGNNSPFQNPTHQYAENGTYNVCLTASNLSGVDTHCEEIVIDAADPPQAFFTFTHNLIGEYDFVDQSTNNPTSWFWEFGDDSTSTEQNPMHLYYFEGDYTVCLTVTNDTGSDQTCETISVTIQDPPFVDFSTNPVDYNVIEFTDLTINDPISWSWNFGDGENSNEQNPTHTYQAEGSYNVCLGAGNQIASASLCKTVDVIFPATASPWEAHWKMQPNPTTDFLYVTLDENQLGAEVAIYSILGKKMHSSIYEGNTQLDFSKFTNGTYILKIVKDKKVVGITKVIKQ